MRELIDYIDHVNGSIVLLKKNSIKYIIHRADIMYQMVMVMVMVILMQA